MADTEISKLIPITVRPIGGKEVATVDARKLHSYLGIGKHFSTWMHDHIARYQFSAGTDYVRILLGRYNSKDYHLTLDAAKNVLLFGGADVDKRRAAYAYFLRMQRAAPGGHSDVQAKAAPPAANRDPAAARPPVYPRYDVRPTVQAGDDLADRIAKETLLNDEVPVAEPAAPVDPVGAASPASAVARFQFSICTASGSKAHYIVRTVTRGGEPWFVLADVCRVLEIANPRDAATRLDNDEKAGVVLTDVSLNGVTQERAYTAVSEGGLYTLILRSDKPQAKPFRKWVTSEVLPAIRKTGGYIGAAPEETPESLALRAMRVLQATVDRQAAANASMSAELAASDFLNSCLERRVSEAAPKAEAFDRLVLTPGRTYTVTESAKHWQLKPGEAFTTLNGKRWLYRSGHNGPWLAHQQHLNNGNLVHKATQKANGNQGDPQVRVTEKGLKEMARLLRKEGKQIDSDLPIFRDMH